MLFNNSEVMKCLPLVATVLGKKYSVSVEFRKSTTAYTDGRTVYIPDIAQTEEGVRLARGYIDHEAGGHLRFTDFNSWNNVHLDKTQYFICNAIEDWRVERKLREIYPGCGENLDWLSLRFFADETTYTSGDEIRDCLNYILLSVRSWETPEIADANCIDLKIDLKKTLDSILEEVRASCRSTSDAVGYARRLGKLIEEEVGKQKKGRAGELDGSEKSDASDSYSHKVKIGCRSEVSNGSQGASHDDTGSLGQDRSEGCSTGSAKIDGCGQLVAGGSGHQLKNVGELLQEALGVNARQGSKDGHARLVPATVITVPADGSGYRYMTMEERRDALIESAKLRRKLQTVLMSKVAKSSWVGSSGRMLSCRCLSRVALGSSKVFSKVEEKEGFDVHVELLLDCSSSMKGSALDLALNACYALAYALLDIPGIQVDIDAFPCSCCDTIMPIPFSRRKWIRLEAIGTTPLGQSLIYYFQKAVLLKQKHKLCIVITDGAPDDMISANEAVKISKRIDVMLFGIGILSRLICDILGNAYSKKISSLSDISNVLFKTLKDNLNL